MRSAKARALLELRRRQKPIFNPESLFDPQFPQQNNFIKDPAKLKALFCTRRAAKSFTAGLYLLYEALTNPGVNCLFIGLTRLSAKGIVWKDILKVLNQKHNLGAKFNSTELTMTLPNGSVIWVTGADADEDEMNKLLGKKYRLVCLDEASMYTVDLRKLVYGILKPATADQRGTICMMGTSSNFTRGLFYDITNGVEPAWSLHTWSAHDNPYMRVQWQEELDEIQRLRPAFMETSLFKQWYLNEWVVDEDALVYKFNTLKNLYSERPHLNPDGWSYVMGVDLGFEDDSAFVIGAYHENDKTLYIISTFNKKHMDITDVANKIKELQAQYGVTRVIIDGANKQATEEITRRHGIALEPADKREKVEFIEILNAELIQSHVKINKNCIALISELKQLVWATDGEKIKIPKKEHPALPNHLCDAFLYAWRFCYQYLAEPVKEKVAFGSPVWYQQQSENLFDKALEHFQNEEARRTGTGW